VDLHGEVSVTVSGGMLKPDGHEQRPEGARFRALLRPVEPDPVAAAKAMEALRRISDSGTFRSGSRKLTRDEMHERD
jgi:hypothetical protein